MKRRVVAAIITVPLLLILCLCGYSLHQIYKPYPGETMTENIHKAKGMTCHEILDQMFEDGVKINAISKILQTTPSTVIRLHTGQTTPTEGFEASIRQIYLDRLLIGSWWIVRLKYNIITKPDGFSCEINPLQER